MKNDLHILGRYPLLVWNPAWGRMLKRIQYYYRMASHKKVCRLISFLVCKLNPFRLIYSKTLESGTLQDNTDNREEVLDGNVKKDMENLISLVNIGMGRNDEDYSYEGKIADMPNDKSIQAFYVYTAEKYALDGHASKDTVNRVASDILGVDLQNYQMEESNIRLDGDSYYFSVGDWGMSWPYAEIDNVVKVSDHKIKVIGRSGWQTESDDGNMSFDLWPFEATFEENPDSFFHGYTLYEVSFNANTIKDWKASYIDYINSHPQGVEYMYV